MQSGQCRLPISSDSQKACLVQEGSPDRKAVRAGEALHARRVQCVKDSIEGKDPPLINNRQAGRRNRGRNNGRQNGGNRGGENGNRIDNRARGNAPQLLEKYRNLARDAQLAGDRVNTEYYLQFADHYFRVIADNRARQEEHQARFRRNDEPLEYDADNESLSEDFAGVAPSAEGEEDAGRERDDNRQHRNHQQRPARQQYVRAEGEASGEEREDRRRPRRAEKIVIKRVDDNEAGNEVEAVSSAPASVVPVAAEDDAAASSRAPRARKPRPPKADEAEASGLDLAVLPPAIGRADNDDVSGDDGEEKPATRRRTRRPKTSAEAAE